MLIKTVPRFKYLSNKIYISSSQSSSHKSLRKISNTIIRKISNTIIRRVNCKIQSKGIHEIFFQSNCEIFV